MCMHVECIGTSTCRRTHVRALLVHADALGHIFAGHSTVKDFQNYVRGQRRTASADPQQKFQTKSDLLNFAKQKPLPATIQDFSSPWDTYAVDGLVSEWGQYPNTTGIVLTNATSVGWLGQLLKHEIPWALHCDGTHKLAHSSWILLTFGTHHLKWDPNAKMYRHEFCPLVYLFFKGSSETVESTMMGCRGLVLVGQKYFSDMLVQPAAGITDHSEMLRQGLINSFEGMVHMNDWAHLATKYKKGRLLNKSNPFYDLVWPQLKAVHLTHSSEMMHLLFTLLKDVWLEWEADSSRPQQGYSTKTLRKEYCEAPWNTWGMASYDGLGGTLPDGRVATALDLPIILPSNQTEESWHKVRKNALTRIRTACELICMHAARIVHVHVHALTRERIDVHHVA